MVKIYIDQWNVGGAPTKRRRRRADPKNRRRGAIKAGLYVLPFKTSTST